MGRLRSYGGPAPGRKRAKGSLHIRGDRGPQPGMLVLPATPAPGLDAAVDIGAPLALFWHWWTFFRDARRDPPGKPAP